MMTQFKMKAMFAAFIWSSFSPAFSQELPCDVGPRTIRAYSVAESNSICLAWPENAHRQELRVSRRIYSHHPKEWANWVEIYAVTNPVPARDASGYCDTNVNSGVHYEYRISALITNYVCNWRTTVGYWDYQYISTGTEVPLRDQRGKVILLVEIGLAASLPAEIMRLEEDLICDGYQVYRHDVAASEVTAPDWKANVASTKAIVRTLYNTDTNAQWSIFIIGHVPIPYSGLSSPGSHTENFGAHPADWYYADMDENLWTDTTANDTSADYPWNWNIPGDGKFDQRFLPSIPELRVGRVDLRNMPAFGKSETELMRQYLDRNHAWRHKKFTARDRGLIIPSGYPVDSHNTFSSFFGTTTNTDLGRWLSTATNTENSYLFAASKGSGQFTRDMQLGRTSDFAATALYAVFTRMYGSYYGNWDSAMHPDVVLLAPLAAEGFVVSNYYHENVVSVDASAMGEAIGYELFAVGANPFRPIGSRYDAWATVRADLGGAVFVFTERLQCFTSLMGDPTLRLRVVASPAHAILTVDGADNVISWARAVDSHIQGYHVYRAPVTNRNNFTRLTSTPVVSQSFRDVEAAAGAYRYMVRTVKLEQSPNRSYYNASQGVFATVPPTLQAVHNPEGGFALHIQGEPGRPYTVEYATNLSHESTWYPLTNITLFGQSGTFRLENRNSVIFYRVKH
jgi:hypothetical protein